MSGLQVVLLRPGRPSFGERRRAAGWREIVEAAGGSLVEIEVMGDRPHLDVRSLGGVLSGDIVPEAAAWRSDAVRERLEVLAPNVVILQTARAYRTEVADGPWVTVMDLVDRLSESYRQRAVIRSGLAGLAFRILGAAHARVEQRWMTTMPRRVAAGWTDAAAIDGVWVPIPVTTGPPVEIAPDRTDRPYDAVFSGTLSYEPNIDALRWLASGEATNDLRILVAGHRPTDEVANLCRQEGWTLVEDFPNREWLAEQAHVAIAPLRSTAGIQIKVLEAAAIGLPQVVATAALSGLAPGFPCVVADDPQEFRSAIRQLVEDPVRRQELGDASRTQMVERYAAEVWVDPFLQLIGGDNSAASPSPASPVLVDRG